MNTQQLYDVGPDYSSHWYAVVPGTTTTICALTLTNGFTFVGTASCVGRECFDEEKGRTLAADKVIQKIGQFMGWREADRRTAHLR